jgi:hypothetical protein
LKQTLFIQQGCKYATCERQYYPEKNRKLQGEMSNAVKLPAIGSGRFQPWSCLYGTKAFTGTKCGNPCWLHPCMLFSMRTRTIVIMATTFVFTVVLLILASFSDRFVLARLREWINRQSHGNLELHAGHAEVSLLSRSITFSNLVLYHKTGAAPASTERDLLMMADSFSMKGISVLALLRGNFSCDDLDIRGLFMEIRAGKDERKMRDTTAREVSEKVRTLTVCNISVRDIRILHKDTAEGPKQIRAERLTLHNWVYMHPSKHLHPASFMNADAVELTHLSVKGADRLYRFSLVDASFNKASRSLEMNRLSFHPLMGYEEVAKKIPRAITLYDLIVPHARLAGIAWDSLVSSGFLHARVLAVDSFDLAMFKNNRLPVDTRSKMGRYPAQLLKKLPFSLALDSVSLAGGKIAYTEISRQSGLRAHAELFRIHGNFRNVTNHATFIHKHKMMAANLRGEFAGAPLWINMDFDVVDPAGTFTVKGSAGATSRSGLNAILFPLEGIRFNSLDLHQVNFIVNGNENFMRGEVRTLYDNLEMEWSQKTKNGLNKNELISAVANLLVLKSNPLPGKPGRTVYVTVDREPNRSYFNQLMKTVYTGAMKSTRPVNR